MAVNVGKTATPQDRDAGRVDGDDWPTRLFPPVCAERGKGFQVVCRRSVLDAIQCHGRETLDLEVCGVLVGNVYHDQTGPFLYVEACIRGEHAGNLAAQVTFTSETWTHIHERMEQYPNQRILGWYHTHPDFGIFLSAADLFIHENFFDLPWQVAYVYDPVRAEEGMFVWRDGQARRESFLVENDALAEQPNVVVKSPTQLIYPGEDNPSALAQRVQRLESRFVGIVIALVVVGVLALVWPEAWPMVRSWLQEWSQESVQKLAGALSLE